MNTTLIFMMLLGCDRGFDANAVFPAVISDETDVVIDTDAGPDGTDAPDTASDPPADTDPPGDTASPADTGERIPALVQFDGPTPSNVLMISVDTLRRDALGYYAGEDRDTPTFDRLLADGVSLDRHRSCSNWTYASALCALSGKDNLDMGFVPEAGALLEEQQVSPDTLLISTMLGLRGLRTALVSTNPYIGATYGYDAHYDEIWDGGGELAEGPDVIEQGLKYIEEFQSGSEPWMVHMHFLEPHTPYQPPAEYIEGADTVLGFNLKTPQGVDSAEIAYNSMTTSQQAILQEYAQRMYAAEVRGMDDLLEGLLDTLDASGALDDTLIVLWTDHGEQLWDRGNLTHGKDLHSEEADAVAAFWSKDIIPTHFPLRTAHRDLTPTLLDTLGFSDNRQHIGRALNAEVEGVPIHALRLRSYDTIHSVDMGAWRMLYRWDGTLQVYDLDEDPDELENLVDLTDADQYALWLLMEPEVERAINYYETPSTPQMPAWDVK